MFILKFTSALYNSMGCIYWVVQNIEVKVFHFETIHLVPICNDGIGECGIPPLEGVGANTHSPSSCCSFPMSDSSSRFVQLLLPLHNLISACNLVNLSTGRLVSSTSVSSSIPRKTSLVAGPSVLWAAMGTPRV